MVNWIRKKVEDIKKRSKIPRGYYCHDSKNMDKICPYWRLDAVHTEEQENGYCEYLGKGDWDLNKEKTTIKESRRQEDGTYKETIYENTSWHDLGLTESLLWDQCKMCGKR